MSDADRAYKAAQALIEEARKAGEIGISFDTEECRALSRIPPEISDLSRLRGVILDNTSISDLTPLSSLAGLIHLSIIRTHVTDLAPLVWLTGLKNLKLEQTNVADLTPLTSLTEVGSLDFSGTKVTDLVPLAAFTKLQHLYLNQTNVTDLGPLSALRALISLDLDQTYVTNLGPLVALTKLQVLYLERTAVSDLTPLSHLTSLEDLSLSGSKVIDLRPLNSLHKLGKRLPVGLTYQDTPATAHDADLARIAQIEHSKDRTEQTIFYLRSLPPWPEPYTPRATPDGSPPKPIGPTQAPFSPHPETTTATPVDEASTATKPLPQGLPRRITATRARQVLQAHSQDLREQCQFVTDQINQTLAQQIPAKPNDPEQLAAWTHLVNTLELSRTAIMSLHEAIPDRTEHRPVTDDEANRLKHAFEAAIAKLQEASAYIDGPGEAHGRTYAGLLKIGVCSVLAAPIALISAQPVALIGAGLYTMFYGKGAALEVLKAIGVAPAPK